MATKKVAKKRAKAPARRPSIPRKKKGETYVAYHDRLSALAEEAMAKGHNRKSEALQAAAGRVAAKHKSVIKPRRSKPKKGPRGGTVQRKGPGTYPWKTCMEQQTKRYGSKKIAEKVCGSIRGKSRKKYPAYWSTRGSAKPAKNPGCGCGSSVELPAPRKGLEGPFVYPTGRVLFYDPKEGAYYDHTTDLYLDTDEVLAVMGMSKNPVKKVDSLTSNGYKVEIYSLDGDGHRVIWGKKGDIHQVVEAPWITKAIARDMVKRVAKYAKKGYKDPFSQAFEDYQGRSIDDPIPNPSSMPSNLESWKEGRLPGIDFVPYRYWRGSKGEYHIFRNIFARGRRYGVQIDTGKGLKMLAEDVTGKQALNIVRAYEKGDDIPGRIRLRLGAMNPKASKPKAKKKAAKKKTAKKVSVGRLVANALK